MASTLLGSIICAMAGAPVAAQEAGGQTIVLFGANWCAPCVAELRDLGRISTLARPAAVRLVWLDSVPRLPRSVTPGSVPVVTGREARALFASYGEGNAGLPLAVMLDPRGRRCAMVRARLDEGAIAAMRQACAQKAR